MNHLQNLEAIAMQYNGSRTALTGYNASVDYVLNTLTSSTNYQVKTFSTAVEKLKNFFQFSIL
jgi:hypothetical protein